MAGRHLGGGGLAVLFLAGTAVAVAPLEPPRTTFQALELATPAAGDVHGNGERRVWGLSVRTTGDDVPFPEREPAILVAARDVDPETQLVRSAAIVVRTARASGWLGGPGAAAKVDALREDALAEATKRLEAAPAEGQKPGSPVDGRRRVVAVLALGSDWPALDRAFAFSLTESLLKAQAADVVDLDSAERFLGDLGMTPAADRSAEPPLSSWAEALGVDAVAAVRATAVRMVASADDGADFLGAEVLWSRAGGGIDRSTTSLRMPHRSYPARGKLSVLLSQADVLSGELSARLPPAGTGGALFASRDLTAIDTGTGTGGASGNAPPVAGERSLSFAGRDISGAATDGSVIGNEDPGLAGPGFRSDSGAPREVPVANPVGYGAAIETASGVTVDAERRTGDSRSLGGAAAAGGASMEMLALSGLGPDGSSGESRSVRGAGVGRGGSLEDLSLGPGPAGARDGGNLRDVGGLGADGRAGPESLALVGPAARGSRPPADKDTSAADADWCALAPRARALGDDAWLVHHPLDRALIIPDGDPMLEAIARRLAADRGTRVRVVGHTCSVGTAEYNFTLGSLRSDRTRERLIELGVPAAQIDSTSEGEGNPRCTNETRVGRMNNRRTEIRIEAGSDRNEER